MTSRMVHRHKRPTLKHHTVSAGTSGENLASPTQQQQEQIAYTYPENPAWQATFIVFLGAILSAIFLFTSPLLDMIFPNHAQVADSTNLMFIGLIFSAVVVLLYWLDVGLTYVLAVSVLDANGKIEHLAYQCAIPSMLIFVGSVGMLCISMNERSGDLWIGMGLLFLILPFTLVGVYVDAVREALHLSEGQAKTIGTTKVVMAAVIVLIVIWMLLESIQW